MYLSRIPRRSFVSTLLLSRTWENLTVLELRKEAKVRGLSSQGNKSTLIARIKEHEQNSVTSAPPPINTPRTIRSASTNLAPPAHPKKTVQATAPGIPLPAQPDRASAHSDFLAIKLPDLSQPPRDAPVQVPYLPDFWDSARPQPKPPLELERPKLHVVSGSATHYNGGPTHNLEKHQEDGSPATTVDPPASREVGLWADFWESLGLPRSFSTRRTLSEAGRLAAQSGKHEFRAHSRPLTDEERRGLYILLGIVGGSWLVGGLVN